MDRRSDRSIGFVLQFMHSLRNRRTDTSSEAAIGASIFQVMVHAHDQIWSNDFGNSMLGIESENLWHHSARPTTDDYPNIDVRRWACEGMLVAGYQGGWQWSRAGETVSICVRTEAGRVILSYPSRGSEWKDNEYPICIVRTRCHLGGTRPWFICPVVDCRRRVAMLYRGNIFACRHCHRLTFASTREDASFRAARRANRLRERLGWEPGILNRRGGKPKWMRWRTFFRLRDRHDEFRHQSLQLMAVKLGLFDYDFPEASPRRL